MMNFTNDEMNLMCIYQSDSRSGLIAALTEMRGYLDEDEAELRDLTDSALQKLGEITDEQFAALELALAVIILLQKRACTRKNFQQSASQRKKCQYGGVFSPENAQNEQERIRTIFLNHLIFTG